MEVRNRIAELEENFKHSEAFLKAANYKSTREEFKEYEAAEWLLNSSMWKEEGVERY
jgi:CHASE1-domain containing sensor protein